MEILSFSPVFYQLIFDRTLMKTVLDATEQDKLKNYDNKKGCSIGTSFFSII